MQVNCALCYVSCDVSCSHKAVGGNSWHQNSIWCVILLLTNGELALWNFALSVVGVPKAWVLYAAPSWWQDIRKCNYPKGLFEHLALTTLSEN